jgi:hypothetical protein
MSMGSLQQALVNMIMNLWVPQRAEYLTSWLTVKFSVPWNCCCYYVLLWVLFPLLKVCIWNIRVAEWTSAILVNSYGNILLVNVTFSRNITLMLIDHSQYIWLIPQLCHCCPHFLPLVAFIHLNLGSMNDLHGRMFTDKFYYLLALCTLALCARG